MDQHFKLGWKRPSAYSTIRHIINGLSSPEFEQAFRQYSQKLATSETELRLIHCDGKACAEVLTIFKTNQPSIS